MLNRIKKIVSTTQELWVIIIVFSICIYSFSININSYSLKMNADGKGYFDYLPATFIYHDLNWNYMDTLVSDFYVHKVTNNEIINNIGGGRVNRYPCGTAIMMSPAFLLAHIVALNSSYKADGYSIPYQYGVLLSSFIFLFIGLFYLKKILFELFNLNNIKIFFIQIAIVLSTSLLHYTYNESAFSHVYSFALIILFNYLWIIYAKHKQVKYLFLIALIYGFIALVRPVNLLVIIFLPFYFEGLNSFTKTIKDLFITKYIYLIGAVALFIMVVSIQLFIWKYQTGHFFVDSYQGQGFNFLSPEYFNFLFSYRKGAFIYAPILFLFLVVGLVSIIKNKHYYKAIVLFVCLNIIFYVLSSWEFWDYGSSFGQRPLVDFYVYFAILGGYCFTLLNKKHYWILILLILACSGLGTVQTYQYKNFILHWDKMTKKKYWSVFLKTNQEYMGYIWFPKYKHYNFNIIDVLSIDDETTFNPNTQTTLISDLAAKNRFNFDLVHMKCSMKSEDEHSKFIFCINKLNGENIYWSERSTFMFEKNESNWGKGDFYFNFEGLNEDNYIISISVVTKNKPLTLQNIEMELINLKMQPATKSEQKMINNIIIDSIWLENIKQKSQKNKIEIESQLLLDAQYMLLMKK